MLCDRRPQFAAYTAKSRVTTGKVLRPHSGILIEIFRLRALPSPSSPVEPAHGTRHCRRCDALPLYGYRSTGPSVSFAAQSIIGSSGPRALATGPGSPHDSMRRRATCRMTALRLATPVKALLDDVARPANGADPHLKWSQSSRCSYRRWESSRRRRLPSKVRPASS
jgi:hypothetical protein